MLVLPFNKRWFLWLVGWCILFVLEASGQECEPCPQLHNRITSYAVEIGASGQECPVCVPCTICEYGYARTCTARHNAICSKTKLYDMEEGIIGIYVVCIALVYLWHHISVYGF